jgi:hypothetical protein
MQMLILGHYLPRPPLLSITSSVENGEFTLQAASCMVPEEAFMLFENVWATTFRDAVLNANGEIVMIERIPKAVIDELLAGEPETATQPLPSPTGSIEQPQM